MAAFAKHAWLIDGVYRHDNEILRGSTPLHLPPANTGRLPLTRKKRGRLP